MGDNNRPPSPTLSEEDRESVHDEDELPPPNQGADQPPEVDQEEELSAPEPTLPDLKMAQAIIKSIQEAQLEDDIKDPVLLEALCNPRNERIEIDASLDASLRLYNTMCQTRSQPTSS
ncbi:hypothetical protein BDN72DRAFT_896486 [Pluteus cervinus]|uniref:Uncharacterized protein n=1 Tax=Pluteus cervinus TaxID=181527 RepID=A0ACD3AXT9_9AGAR|nr:hypothetical protein BDN72DRAFT_896486 [Pluteus cervinus]